MKTITFDAEALENELLGKHSTFRIGGPADYAVFPKTTDELTDAVKICKENGIRFAVIGRGSNLLFDDIGYRGAVIFTEKIDFCVEPEPNVFACGAGVSLVKLCRFAEKKGLAGLEFAFGIPGSIGGALVMNAGAFGGEIASVLESAEVFDSRTGQTVTFKKDELGFSYRHSLFSENPSLVILSARIRLDQRKDPKEISAKMNEYMTKRKNSQPLSFPSAGSYFKRPGENIFAGKLIDEAGLKGKRIGDAAVSDKHAGFIVNVGNATAKDVLTLADFVCDTVETRTGIRLEPEVRFLAGENG